MNDYGDALKESRDFLNQIDDRLKKLLKLRAQVRVLGGELLILNCGSTIVTPEELIGCFRGTYSASMGCARSETRGQDCPHAAEPR